MTITVYSLGPSCVQCTATLRALESKGLPFEVTDLSNETAREHLKALGYLQAPVVITDTGHWSGFRPDKIQELYVASLAASKPAGSERRAAES